MCVCGGGGGGGGGERNSAFFWRWGRGGSGKPIMLFFLLINVKMPTIGGILTFMSRKNFMLS